MNERKLVRPGPPPDCPNCPEPRPDVFVLRADTGCAPAPPPPPYANGHTVTRPPPIQQHPRTPSRPALCLCGGVLAGAGLGIALNLFAALLAYAGPPIDWVMIANSAAEYAILTFIGGMFSIVAPLTLLGLAVGWGLSKLST